MPVYRPYASKKSVGAREDFYSPSSRRVIQQLIVDIVEHEGPVSLGLATRRITAHWGYERIPERAVEQVRGLVPLNKIQIHSSGSGFFLWTNGVCPEAYKGFRVPSPNNPESLREAKDLPVEEVANAILYLLQRHISAPYDAIVRETSRLFGFQRIGKQLEDRMSAGIDCLIARGTARREGVQIIFHQSEAEHTS